MRGGSFAFQTIFLLGRASYPRFKWKGFLFEVLILSISIFFLYAILSLYRFEER